jgi:hypothetical protein
MRKTGFVLLGLLLVAGAIGTFSYRSLYLPHKARTTFAAPSAGAPAADRGRSYIPERDPTNRTTSGAPRPSGGILNGMWGNVEMVINVLNVVVGVLGIWMTMIGMRLQRQALRQDDR